MTASTLFEKLPSSDFADRYLKPIAMLLRFENSTEYLDPGLRLRDVRACEELERTFLDAVQLFERNLEEMPARKAVEVGRLIERIQRDLRREKARVAGALDGGDNA